MGHIWGSVLWSKLNGCNISKGILCDQSTTQYEVEIHKLDWKIYNFVAFICPKHIYDRETNLNHQSASHNFSTKSLCPDG